MCDSECIVTLTGSIQFTSLPIWHEQSFSQDTVISSIQHHTVFLPCVTLSASLHLRGPYKPRNLSFPRPLLSGTPSQRWQFNQPWWKPSKTWCDPTHPIPPSDFHTVPFTSHPQDTRCQELHAESLRLSSESSIRWRWMTNRRRRTQSLRYYARLLRRGSGKYCSPSGINPPSAGTVSIT